MNKLTRKIVTFFTGALLTLTLAYPAAQASTRSRQFQLNGGVGVFVGTEGLDAAFDFSLEPEFFFTEHNTLSFRFDITAGALDAAHLGARWRYYFNITQKIDIFVGLGIGGIINFNGGGFGDAALPVFGWQYDLGEHLKIGSDMSFDIIWNNNNVAFAARLMPAVLKWAF